MGVQRNKSDFVLTELGFFIADETDFKSSIFEKVQFFYKLFTSVFNLITSVFLIFPIENAYLATRKCCLFIKLFPIFILIVLVSFAFSIDIHEQLPMQKVVKTEIISSREDIDPDVLTSISSLGCFHDKERLIEKLLREE